MGFDTTAVGANGLATGNTAGSNTQVQMTSAQQDALRMTQEMNDQAAIFQAQMGALKAVSEALNAGNDARNKAIEKTGQAGR